jgi:hypothetical protein
MAENKPADQSATEEKRAARKKDVWEIVSIVSTILTPVLLALLGYFISEKSKSEERKQLTEQSERNDVFRKTELLEKFGPYLYDTSQLKNKIGIIGMYTIDTMFALQLATIINSPGTQSAIRALFKSSDSTEQNKLETVLLNTQQREQPTTIDSSSPGGMALKKALEEFEAGAKEIPPGSNSGPFVKKYFSAIGLDLKAPWSTAFVAWCFLSNPSLTAKLAFMKTPSPEVLFSNLKKAGMILNNSESPKPGDIVFLRRQTNGVLHTAILQSWENDIYYTIEGNVGSDDGGAVQKRATEKNKVYAVGRVQL